MLVSNHMYIGREVIIILRSMAMLCGNDNIQQNIPTHPV